MDDIFTQDFWQSADKNHLMGRKIALNRTVLSKRGHFRKNWSQRIFFVDNHSIK